jgi:hypothetical protein
MKPFLRCGVGSVLGLASHASLGRVLFLTIKSAHYLAQRDGCKGDGPCQGGRSRQEREDCSLEEGETPSGPCP